MDDKARGLYDKFTVERTDGSSGIGMKHRGCRYFVLDITHDKHSISALRAYAESCMAEYPLLGNDLLDIVERLDSGAQREERHMPRITHLVPGAYWALLRRWDKKYNDPRNEDYEWARADKNERHAINACLDLRDTLKANDDLLAAAKAALPLVEAAVAMSQELRVLAWGYTATVLDREIEAGKAVIAQLQAAIRKAEE